MSSIAASSKRCPKASSCSRRRGSGHLCKRRCFPGAASCAWPASCFCRAHRQIDNDESLGSFVRRRFGREALERVAQPLVGGIYAADPEQLSLAATMPRFLEMERNQRSVIRSMWSDQRRRARRREAGSGARWSLFVTLADGMQELVDAVAGRLPENSIRYNAPASAVNQNPATQKWHVKTKAGESLDADAVIVATPALHAAPLLRAVAGDRDR